MTTDLKNGIKEHLSKLDLDIRNKSQGYSRFMDQKVTPDVLQFLAECILNHINNSSKKDFTVRGILDSSYFRKNVTRNFGKPSPDDKRTNSEYDKFVSQPIQVLLYAKILNGKTKNRAVEYEVANLNLLHYIATHPQNAYYFLYQYISKVLIDSGFYGNFEKYRDTYLMGTLTKSEFGDLKEKFISFIIGNTNIRGETEVKRIFPKILNIFAAENRLPGTIRGFMSKYPFLPSDLIYNRTNFRDINKYKGISRQEAEDSSNAIRSASDNDLDYRVARAKTRVKQLHPTSEIKDQWRVGDATQVHHIFPKNEFPQISDRLENLIRLTPTQHNTKAHPGNSTHKVDKDYQCMCLIEKSHSIEKSINKGQFDYSKESFIGVVNTGLKQNLPFDLTFNQIRTEIKNFFRK